MFRRKYGIGDKFQLCYNENTTFEVVSYQQYNDQWYYTGIRKDSGKDELVIRRQNALDDNWNLKAEEFEMHKVYTWDHGDDKSPARFKAVSSREFRGTTYWIFEMTFTNCAESRIAVFSEEQREFMKEV